MAAEMAVETERDDLLPAGGIPPFLPFRLDITQQLPNADTDVRAVGLECGMDLSSSAALLTIQHRRKTET